jgi:hypothetical protein
MAHVTVSAAFELADRATPKLRDIRRELRGTQRDAVAAGAAMDELSGPRGARQLRELHQEMGTLGSETKATRAELRGTSRTLGTFERRAGAATDRTGALRREMHSLARETRDAGDGLAAGAGALRTFDRRAHTMAVTTRRAGGALDSFTTRAKLMGAAALVALPVIEALGGAAGALGASLAGAGLGAGAIGLAGGGVLGTGVAALAAIALPAKQRLQDLSKAQTRYTQAVQDFGRKSREARTAQRELDQARAAAPAGGVSLIRQQRALGREWDRATRPGQASLFGLGTFALRRLRGATPSLARDANMVAGATRAQGGQLAEFLTGDFSRGLIRANARVFSNSLDEVEDSAENVAVTIGRLERAALPFLHDGTIQLARWTREWRENTTDVAHNRKQIGGYVDDLKAWGRLAGHALELTRDLLSPGRASGTGLVTSLSDQLQTWDRWAQRNPDKLQDFFESAAADTRDIARSVGSIVSGLHNLSQELRPLIGPLSHVADLLAVTGGQPGALAAAFGGYRGLRTAAGARGPRGGSGGLPPMAGGAPGVVETIAAGGGVRAALSGRGALMGGRLLRGGSAILRGAGKAWWPAMLAMAGLDVLGTPGTAAERAQAALSGATLGLVPRPVLGTEQRTRGSAAAGRFVDRLGDASTLTAQRAQIRALGAQIHAGRFVQHGGDALFDGPLTSDQRVLAARANRAGLGHMTAKELDEYTAALARQRDELVAANKTAEAAHRADLRHGSRVRAQGIFSDLAAGDRRITARQGAQAGTHRTVSAALDAMHSLGPAGKRELAQMSLDMVRQAAHDNPKLRGEYERLVAGVEGQFRRLHRSISIVNGQILTGSKGEWSAIADSITSAARRGVSETSAQFQALRQQAVGSLEQMGFSHADALRIVQGVAKGGARGAAAGRVASTRGRDVGAKIQAGVTTAADVRSGNAAPTASGTGDGLGDGPGDRMTLARSQQAGGGATGLLGANPNLLPYAQLGSSMGLHVTSGLRRGAITASGNVSYHASGHAIDESGSPAAMRRYALEMAQRYGSGLEELIHSPLGWGIKRGKKVPNSFFGPAVIAQHYNHVHVADVDPSGAGGLVGLSMDTAGPGGMLGVQIPSLTARGSGLAGIPGAMSDAAGKALAAGMTDAINSQLGAGGFGSATPGAGGKYGKGALEALWVQAGGDPSVANIAAAIALAESGGNPAAHNRSGASGLWQILGNPFPGNAFDPATNARMAVAKWRAAHGFTPWTTYTGADTPGHAKTYQQYLGDGVGWGGWHAKGGAFTVDRPTLFGAGERGSERVSIERADAPHAVHVEYSPSITIHANDKASVRRELRRAADELADEIEKSLSALEGTEVDLDPSGLSR